jgi:hypothetical protein
MTVQKYIKEHSIDNIQYGKVTARDENIVTVQVGIVERTCFFSGSANVGQIVALQCPDGDFSKACILGTFPAGYGEGGNIEI